MFKFTFCFVLSNFAVLHYCLLGIVNGAEGDFFTSKEKAAIDKLRPLVTKYLTQDYMKTDLYLLRWLKAADFDVKKTVDNMQKSNKWRSDNRIDSLIKENTDAHARYLPYRIDGYDRKGNPILQLWYGKWEIRKYVLAGKRDTVIRYWWQMTERLEQKVYETAKSTGKNITEFYYLNDLNGFSFTQHACLACVPIIADIARSHDPNHPYFIVNATFINSPRIFSPIFTLLKEIVQGPTLAALSNYGHDRKEWTGAVFKDIDPTQLSKSFGGTKPY